MKLSTKLKNIDFNEDGSLFVVPTLKGCTVYSVWPESVKWEHNTIGSTRLVTLLGKTNILLFVSAMSNKKFSNLDVNIWDSGTNKVIGTISVKNEIKKIYIRKDYIIISTSNVMYIYNFPEISLYHRIETSNNARGIFSVNCHNKLPLKIAFPSINVGVVYYKNYHNKTEKFIKAHKGVINNVMLNMDGRFLATSSEQGTIIRVWDMINGSKVHDFRRGNNTVFINKLSFSFCNKWLAVSSYTETVHIFKLKILNRKMIRFDKNENVIEHNNIMKKKSYFAMGNLFNNILLEKAFGYYKTENGDNIAMFNKHNKLGIINRNKRKYIVTLDERIGRKCSTNTMSII